MKYFTKTTGTEAELKDYYRELVQIHHPDKPTGSKEAFQELQEEYDAEMLRIKNPRIADNKFFKGLHSGCDEMLKQLGLNPINEILPDFLCRTIDKIKFIPEQFKPMIKMVATSQLGNVESIANFIQDFYSAIKPKKK